MPVDQFLGAEIVIATIFGAIGARCAIATDRCRHPGPLTTSGSMRRVPNCIARLTNETDAESNQLAGLLWAQAAPREAEEGGLVARTRADIGPGSEIVFMHLANQLRIIDQRFRRPKRIAKIGAAALQF